MARKTKPKTPAPPPEGSKLRAFFNSVNADKRGKELIVSSYKDPRIKPPSLSTGFYSLDDIIDGGFRGGTLLQIYGAEGTGKTTLAMYLMAECQRQWNRPVCFLDFENSWYVDRAESIGVDCSPDKFMIWEPPSQEDGYDILLSALSYVDEKNKDEKGAFGLVVIDSLAAMPVIYETEHSMDKATMAYQARNNSKAMRLLLNILKTSIVVFINQIRDDLNPKQGGKFQPRPLPPGGRAVLHAMHYIVEARRSFDTQKKMGWNNADQKEEEKPRQIGHDMHLEVRKSKVCTPFGNTDIYLDYETGLLDKGKDILSFLMKKGVMWKSGQYYYHGSGGDNEKYRYKSGALKFIRNNPEVVAGLLEEALAKPVGDTVKSPYGTYADEEEEE